MSLARSACTRRKELPGVYRRRYGNAGAAGSRATEHQRRVYGRPPPMLCAGEPWRRSGQRRSVLGFRLPVRKSRVKNELVGKHCQLKMAVKRSSTILWKWDVPLRPTPVPGGDWALSFRDLRRGGGARSGLRPCCHLSRDRAVSLARPSFVSQDVSSHCEARIMILHFHIFIFISASFYMATVVKKIVNRFHRKREGVRAR